MVGTRNQTRFLERDDILVFETGCRDLISERSKVVLLDGQDLVVEKCGTSMENSAL